MAKFLQETPKKEKHGNLTFAIVMVVYAIVFVAAAALFLNWFWGFIDGYERSQTKVTIRSYMDQLTTDHILDTTTDLIAQVDHNLQSEEECRQLILDILSSEITYARKSSECTETKQVYILRCGTQVIGSFTISAGEPDEFGFAPWQVTNESFDFSFLLGQPMSITVPEGYRVHLNGNLLDDAYITGRENLPFPVLDELRRDYDALPEFTWLTYGVGPLLGEYELTATDPEGTPFVNDGTLDLDTFADNCTDQEVAELRKFSEEFIRRYVVFTGCANDDRYDNYYDLAKLIVLGSDLDKRLKDALDGLQYAQSKGDQIDTITIHHFIDLGDGKYLVDLNYLVNTTGLAGVVQTSNNLKLVITKTATGLKTEALYSY